MLLVGGAPGRQSTLQTVWSVVLLAGNVGWVEQLEMGAPFHHWQGLCLADVEGQSGRFWTWGCSLWFGAREFWRGSCKVILWSMTAYFVVCV